MRQYVTTGIATLFAVGAVIVLATMIVRLEDRVEELEKGNQDSALSARLDDLSSQVTSLREDLTAAETTYAPKETVTAVGKRVKLFEECIPELRDAIYATDVEYFGEGDFLVTNNARFSRVCNPIFFGNGLGE